MNPVMNKMKELFTENDVSEAVNQGIQESAPVIAQQTVSPDNVTKRYGLFKQGVVSNIGVVQ